MVMMKQIKIVVTGGAGFIGSNLTDALLTMGYQVVVLDNFSTGKRENLAHLAGHPAFTLIEGDIREPADCRKAVAGAQYVFHEAALGSVPRSVKDPMTSTAVNILGFVNMLYAAQEAGVRRFIYASSSSVYGDEAALPKTEVKTGKPLSPYAITKVADELFAENFHVLYGIDTIGMRYFNVFGQRQDPDGAYAAVIPAFVKKMLSHESPVIHGDGSFSRDFTYVENVVRANILAMQTEDAEAVNQVYNIACGDETTLNQLVGCLREELSKQDVRIAAIQPVYGPERPGDIPHSRADISKAGRLLHYLPQVSVHAGIAKAAAWYFQHLK